MTTKKKIELPSFDLYLEKLDLSLVEKAIEEPDRGDTKPPIYSNDELKNIKEMILSTAEHWLPRDMYEIEITGIEKRYDNPKAYIDIEGVIKKPYFDSMKEFEGKKIVIDWKTRDGELDTRWKDQKIDSYQWRIYSSVVDASVFSYRGVSRRCLAGDCPTREVLIAVPALNHVMVGNQLIGVREQINSLIAMNQGVWPQNFDSCYDFNRECPFKIDCDDYTMPRFVPASKDLSFTSMSHFLRCSEFYRRLQGSPNADDTEESKVGTGFHKGIAELYRQAVEIGEIKLG